ncbi:alpha/beta hydrolase, partial [Mycobacterium sp.]|uniref:alpha/beta hydrolase n=1 Tax=Mycobacterium sp. TaxID=1785 RepID=UPI003C73DF04
MTQTNLTRPQGLNRIDPVLREAAVELGVVEFRAETLPAEREYANLRAAQRAAAVDTDGSDAVAIESRSIAGPGGQQLGLRLYRGPTESPAPVAVYAHGGAFVTGNLDTDHAHCVELARAAGCLVVSVDYRLAPENPCPAALDDVEAAFRHAVDNCADLDADAGRIAVMGRDAGAALVAGLTQRVFDQEGPQILVQILHQPMLDSDATPSRREFQRTPGLNGPAVSRAWSHYLGHASADGQHLPANRANLEGLAPTFISCSE